MNFSSTYLKLMFKFLKEIRSRFHRKDILFFVLGLILCLSFTLGYSHLIRVSQLLNYRIFDWPEYFSWVKTSEGISRKDARGNYENTLLSRDQWTNFELEFTVYNPRNCGVVFNHKGTDDFYLIVFDNRLGSVFGMRNEGGSLKTIVRMAVELSSPLHCVLKVKDNQALFLVEEEVLVRMDLPRAQGKIGLLLQDVAAERTSFDHISIRGYTARGDFIVSDGKNTSPGYARAYDLSVLFLYLIMTAFSFYLAFLYRHYFQNPHFHLPNFSVRRIRSPVLLVVCLHLAIAVFLFRSFIFRGQVLISSSDNYGEIFPLFFLSKHNFIKILQGESLCLWNPFAHNGIPFYSNHWNMIYYPLNWLIMLFRDADVLTLLTLRTFLEVFCIGLFAHGFFLIELRSRRWALFCSVVYQLCSFLIFSFTIFPTTTLFFSMTFYLYVLWSVPARRTVWNYLLLTSAVVLILTSANVAFMFYAVLSLAVITAYRFYSLKKPKAEMKTAFIVTLLSVLTGLLISSIRVIPCLLGVLRSNRIVDHYYTLHDYLFLLTRLFVPEISGNNEFNLLSSPGNLRFIYQQAHLPFNPQNAFFVYFGIIPVLLLLLTVLIKLKGNALFWKVYCFLSLAIGLLLQPFWGIFSILCFPLNHHSYHAIIIPVGLCALAGYAGKYLEKKRFFLPEIEGKYVLVLGIVQAFILVILTYVFPVLTNFTRVVFLLMALGYVQYIRLRNKDRVELGRYLSIASLVIEGFLWIAVFWASAVVWATPVLHKENAVIYIIIPLTLGLTVLLSSVRIYKDMAGEKWPRKHFWAYGAGGILIAAIISAVKISHPSQDVLGLTALMRNYFIFFLFGQLRFLIVLFIALGIVGLCVPFGRMRRSVVGLFVLVTLLDLLIFHARYENVVAPHPARTPFYSNRYPYSDMNKALKSKLNLTDFRCDLLHQGGVNSNKNLIYSFPSYTGIMGYMPKRFHRLITNFGYPPDTILIYPEEAIKDDRLLDLSAVRYRFVNESGFLERLGSLSRMNLLYSYRVIPDDEQLLAELKSETFSPREEILLSRDPNPGASPPAKRPGALLTINDSTNDDVGSRFVVAQRGWLLFLESYDEGWKAYVDGKEVLVYRANYNFMACPVEPGAHTVRFKFLPRDYFVSRNLSLLGVIIFVVTAASFAQERKRRDGK